MYDILPFPNINATNINDLVGQTNNYLIQFKETLEFALMNISIDNLSKELIEKLNTLGADIQKSNEDKEDQLQQVLNKTLTVSDVLNSAAFKAALPQEYLVSAEQIQSSNEPNGINIYAIEEASGEIKQFIVKNGKTPNVNFSVNFETGNLEYTTS